MVVLMMRSTSAALVTLPTQAIALPWPSDLIISQVRYASGSDLSTQTTEQPSSARRMASARPLPMPSPLQPAPVTIATFPARERERRRGSLWDDIVGLGIVRVWG